MWASAAFSCEKSPRFRGVQTRLNFECCARQRSAENAPVFVILRVRAGAALVLRRHMPVCRQSYSMPMRFRHVSTIDWLIIFLASVALASSASQARVFDGCEIPKLAARTSTDQ